MRLPWPFGRGTTSGAAASEPAVRATTGDVPSAPAGPAIQRDAPPTGAWASLPPIQRTVGAAPLVAPAAPFLHDVPGHRPLPPIVQPLGHESAASAPPGLVVAHATPVPSLTSQAAMPTRPVQRRAAGGAPDPVWTGASAEADAPLPVAMPLDLPVAEPATPVRHLTPVAASATVTPASRPLTVAPSIAPSRAPVAQRSAAADFASEPIASASPASGTNTATESSLPLAPRGTPPVRAGSRWSEGPVTARRPGLGSPIPSLPAVAAPTDSPGSAGAVPAAASSPPSSSTSSAAGSGPSRAGLGAPLGALPATAVQRSLTPGALPLIHRVAAMSAAADRPDGGTHAAGGGGHASPSLVSGGGSPASPAPLPPARPLPLLPVSRGAPSDPATTPAVQRSTAASAGLPASATAGAAARNHIGSPMILPLLGARPLRPSVTIQRDPGADGTVASSTPSALPVPARWSAGDALPETVHAAELPRGAADSVPLQRLAAGEAPAPEPVASMHELTFPAAAFVGSPLPPRPGSNQAPTQATSQASTRAVQHQPGAPVAARATGASAPAAALQLARTPGVPAASAPSAVLQQPVTTGQRIEPAPQAAPSGPTPTVQTSLAPGLPTFTATPVVQRIDGAAPIEPPAHAGPTDRELDELSRKLFGRLRGQIRAEIATEREARGLSFDAF